MNPAPSPFLELPKLKDLLDARKAEIVKARLTHFNWDFVATAVSLGISRKSLWELRVKYGIER